VSIDPAKAGYTCHEVTAPRRRRPVRHDAFITRLGGAVVNEGGLLLFIFARKGGALAFFTGSGATIFF
jgi:hypothetical protein